jgi:hypothetical protein
MLSIAGHHQPQRAVVGGVSVTFVTLHGKNLDITGTVIGLFSLTSSGIASARSTGETTQPSPLMSFARCRCKPQNTGADRRARPAQR